MSATSINDLTSFKWARVITPDPLSIQLDGDTAPLALIPDTLVDPKTLRAGDRVRVELSMRKVVIHGKSKGDGSADWAAKAGPTAYVQAYVNTWGRGVDSGGSLDALSLPNYIIVKATGIYEVTAMQRGNAASGYIGIGLDGSRAVLEDRVEGVWTHDHAAANNGFTNSKYMGLLLQGERITVGPQDPTNRDLLQYGAASHLGAVYARRIS